MEILLHVSRLGAGEYCDTLAEETKSIHMFPVGSRRSRKLPTKSEEDNITASCVLMFPSSCRRPFRWNIPDKDLAFD